MGDSNLYLILVYFKKKIDKSINSRSSLLMFQKYALEKRLTLITIRWKD